MLIHLFPKRGGGVLGRCGRSSAGYITAAEGDPADSNPSRPRERTSRAALEYELVSPCETLRDKRVGPGRVSPLNSDTIFFPEYLKILLKLSAGSTQPAKAVSHLFTIFWFLLSSAPQTRYITSSRCFGCSHLCFIFTLCDLLYYL